jgi:hypothetical protein
VRGNPHAAFDVAGAGNVAWSRWCDTRKRKGETTGNTNIDLNRRVSPRPYRWQTGMFNLKLPRHISTLPDADWAKGVNKVSAGSSARALQPDPRRCREPRRRPTHKSSCAPVVPPLENLPSTAIYHPIGWRPDGRS